MKKKVREMAVGVLYILILFYQVAKIQNIKITYEIPHEAAAGNRVTAVLDISGCRGKSVVLGLVYDGDRLAFGGRAGVSPSEGSFVTVQESEIGEEGEKMLEISVFIGEGFFDRGRVSLEFYVKQPCLDIPAHIKLCGVREKLPPQD